MENKTDIIILGGGLAGGLTALALAKRRPALRLLLIDSGHSFGGNHIWSFFSNDIPSKQHWLIKPLIAKTWDRYDVRFPSLRKTIKSTYNSITSEALDAELRKTLPPESLLNGQIATAFTPTSVTLADGRVLKAGAVIDARGCQNFPHLAGGWQKFLGQMVQLSTPHKLTHPILMDARVAQCGGYRFIYVLPFGPDKLFIEDTYYSLSSAMNAELFRSRIAEYCHQAKWDVVEILREEQGLLPVVAKGDFAAFWEATGEPDIARIGAAAGFFHPLTSYSLPMAVNIAFRLAKLHRFSAERLARDTQIWAQAHWRDTSYLRRLCQMLFGATRAEKRYKVFQHFFRLDRQQIERFFALRLKSKDKLRLLVGRPPVSIFMAICALLGRGYPLSPLVPNIKPSAKAEAENERGT